jgi:DNA primase
VKLSLSQRHYLETATDAYHAQAEHAEAYLAERGISRQVADTFRLGVVVEPLVGDSDFIHRLSIPYLTLSGVIDIRYRALLPDQNPKYLSRTGASTNLYNVASFMSDSPVIAICEGELDTIVMSGVVGIPAVGVPGANNWRSHYRLLFEDYERVLVMCDGDQAGREFGKKVAAEVEGATVIHLPDGMDVNDMYLHEGAAALRKRVGYDA